MIIKKIFPWWARIITKIFLSRLPISYDFWSKINLFRHGQMDNSAYAYETFIKHINPDNIKGKIILEIGPGDSLSSGIIASCFGARSILVNPGDFLLDPLKNHTNIKNYLEKRGLSIDSSPKNIEELCKNHKITYYVNGLESLKKIQDKSVDIIFSNAVLEHIYKDEFVNIFEEFRRIIKDEGFMSHQVDFKDHLGGSLNNLRFSDSIWESYLFRNSGFYTNRIRHQKMLNIFIETGFIVDEINLSKWNKLPINTKKLSKQFRKCSYEDLLVSGFKVKLVPNEQ